MTDAEQIRAAVERYIEVMSSGGRDAYVAQFSPDATVEDPVGSDVRSGHEQIGEFWDLVHSLADRITLVRTGPVRVANGQAAFPMQAISDLGDMRMVVDIIDVMTFDDDARITSMRAFWDPAEMRPYEGDGA
jgi:steroid delta-isomerase